MQTKKWHTPHSLILLGGIFGSLGLLIGALIFINTTYAATTIGTNLSTDGNLIIGNAPPTVSLNGEDAYVEGTFEVDGTSRFDNTVQLMIANNSSAIFNFTGNGGGSSNDLISILSDVATLAGSSSIDAIDLDLSNITANAAGNDMMGVRINLPNGGSGTTTGVNVAGSADRGISFTSIGQDITTTGNNDALDINTANSTSSNSGNITIASGTTTTSGATGAISISSGNSIAGSGSVTIYSGDSGGSNNSLGAVTLRVGDGTTSTGPVGTLSILGGAAGGTNTGGQIVMTAGAGSGNSSGGDTSIGGGTGGSTGTGGAVSLSGGAGGSGSGTGGTISITGGNGSGGNAAGGDVTMNAGQSNGSGAGGALTITGGVGGGASGTGNGGNVTIAGGNSGSLGGSNGAGGGVILKPGQPTGSGAYGYIAIGSSTTWAHLRSVQQTAPTIGTPSSCGTSPSASVTSGSTDMAGSFTITAGSGSPAACSTVITFNAVYAAAPKTIVLTPATLTGVANSIYASSTVAASFTVAYASTMGATPGEANRYYYLVIE